MDEHELAWAAGFFDGDGWTAPVRSRRRRTPQPHAQINQASESGVPEVLVRFRDAVGVGRVGGPKIEAGRHPLYRWVASSRGDVMRTGALIGPWLSGEKRAQFASTVGLEFTVPALDCLQWAAGLFDAEGSTSLSDHRSHSGFKSIETAITQGGPLSVPQELARFRSLVSVGENYGPYMQVGANEPVYRWKTTRIDAVRLVVHLLWPWLGTVKRTQARSALMVIDAQPPLPRGRIEWGSHKTYCIHGHEYATARIRPYVSRGGVERRPSKQCLVCTRDQARMRRASGNRKMGGLSAAHPDTRGGDATC